MTNFVLVKKSFQPEEPLIPAYLRNNVLSNLVEERGEEPKLVHRQRRCGAIIELLYRLVKLAEKFQTGIGNRTEDLATIVAVTRSRDEPFGFEPIQQTCDAGRLFNHSLANSHCRQRFVRPSEYSKDIILLQRDAERLQ